MTNILDYIKWRGDLPFSRDPLNGVDALVFAALAYIHFDGRVSGEPYRPISFRDVAEDFFAREPAERRVRVKNDEELLALAAASVRFGQTSLAMYRDNLIPEQETQFAAMTFFLDDGTMMLAFRGTDATLVGWKEDFNMTFQQTIPAQRLALQYTREVAAQFDNPMRLTGHSKGGNLAVFAAARSSPTVQGRILDVYNNDGPGFTKYLMGDPGYLAVVPKIHTYIPQSSVIGMLLEHEEDYSVIHSSQVSIWQHEPYSWTVQGKYFTHVEEITGESRFLDATIKTWFASMTNQERNQFVDVMYALLSTGKVERSNDIFHPKNIRTYVKTIISDENMRRILSAEFQSLVESAKKANLRLQGRAAAGPAELPEGLENEE